MTKPRDVRRAADELLAGPLQLDVVFFERLLSLTNQIVRACEGQSAPECRVAALVLLKARRLAEGIFALILDALGQEAGALFRVLQEAWELLEYLEQDPTRADRLIDSHKPSAGKIAQAIEAKSKPLRDHLNAHASHLSLSYEALGHTLDVKAGRLVLERRPSEKVVRSNLAILFAVLWMCTNSGLGIVEAHDRQLFERVQPELDHVRVEGWTHFEENGALPGE